MGFLPVSANDNTVVTLVVRRVPAPYSPDSRQERYRDPANIKRSQADNLVQADRYAERVGLPLNRFITVSWLLTSTGRLSANAWQRGLKRICQWIRDRDGKIAFVYTHENPTSAAGDDIPNTHILAHLSKHISKTAFARQVETAFDALDGGVDVQPRVIGDNDDTRLNYMIKGASQQTCWAYDGRRKRGGQGIIEIKRCGTSQNIGRAAREGAQT